MTVEGYLWLTDARKTMKSEWIGSSWQRCEVHFMRNIMARVPHREKKRFVEKLKQIWLQPDKELAFQMAEIFSRKYEQAIRCLEEGLEDSLQFYDFPEIYEHKISSTNVVERIIREIRQRS